MSECLVRTVTHQPASTLQQWDVSQEQAEQNRRFHLISRQQRSILAENLSGKFQLSIGRLLLIKLAFLLIEERF